MCLLAPSVSKPYLTRPIETVGAGEGIRTLDPNLGKVVLYPELHPHPQEGIGSPWATVANT